VSFSYATAQTGLSAVVVFYGTSPGGQSYLHEGSKRTKHGLALSASLSKISSQVSPRVSATGVEIGLLQTIKCGYRFRAERVFACNL
jgi:hypothetical protein